MFGRESESRLAARAEEGGTVELTVFHLVNLRSSLRDHPPDPPHPPPDGPGEAQSSELTSSHLVWRRKLHRLRVQQTGRTSTGILL